MPALRQVRQVLDDGQVLDHWVGTIGGHGSNNGRIRTSHANRGNLIYTGRPVLPELLS